MTIRAQHEPQLGVKLASFDFQAAAVERVKSMTYAGVFHEQGLGKTKIAIDIAMYWLENDVVDSVIFVTKRGLVNNWREEFATHIHFPPRVLDQDRAEIYRAFNSPARVYLTHYEVLTSNQSVVALFLKTRRVGVIVDEAQKMKNPVGDVAQALFALRSGFTRRVLLTGTPVANRPQDVWSLIFFLDGGIALGDSFDDFKKAVDLSNDLSSDSGKRARFEQRLRDVDSRISGFCVRETKASSGICLPPKDHIKEYVQLVHRQADIYDDYLKQTERIVVRNGALLLDSADEPLKRLQRLIQVAANPRLVDDSYEDEPAKVPVLRRLVADAYSAGEKTIVWTSYVKNAVWLAELLEAYGAVAIHGELDDQLRSAALKAFKTDSNCKVLVATPGSAKEGLTLVVANRVVFFDRSLSLDDYLQAQDRVHRIGQTKPCTVTSLVATDTVDEWVDALLDAKHAAAQLVQGDVDLQAFRTLIAYDYSEILAQILAARRDRR